MYKYEAVLLGGLPEEGLARAGIKVASKVMIRAMTPGVFILKVKTTNSFELTPVQINYIYCMNFSRSVMDIICN